MGNMKLDVEVRAAPDKVWAVLGDLAGTPRWVPGVAAALLEGTTRICTLADGNVIHEEISEISPPTRGYRYRHVKTPMPVRESSGRFWVTGEGARSTVHVEARLEALDPSMQGALEQMMTGGLRQSLANLKALVEGGR